MRFGAIAAFVLLIPPAAQAADWFSLGEPDDGSFEHFIDLTTVRFDDTIRLAWFKNVYLPKAAPRRGANGVTWLSSRVSLTAFNCERETYRFESIYRYYEDGTVFKSPYGGADLWMSVVPDSMADDEMKFICSLPAIQAKPKEAPPAQPKKSPAPGQVKI